MVSVSPIYQLQLHSNHKYKFLSFVLNTALMSNSKDLISYVVLPRTVNDLLERCESGRISSLDNYISNSSEKFVKLANEKIFAQRRAQRLSSSSSSDNELNYQHKYYPSNCSTRKRLFKASDRRNKKITSTCINQDNSSNSHAKERHYANVVGNKLKFSDAGNVSFNKLQYSKHYSDKKNQNACKCTTCNYQSIKSNAYNYQSIKTDTSKVLVIPHSDESYKSNFYNQASLKHVNLNNDAKDHSLIIQDKCLSCGECFPTKTELMEHYLTHSLTICAVCNKTCPDKWKLKRHLNTHFRERHWKCGDCDQVFLTESELSRHKCARANGPFECRTCKRVFSEKINFTNHIKRHLQEKEHNFPGKSFSVKSRHIKHFEGFRTHKCKICKKSFADNYKLKRHFQIHLKKVHVCNTCNKKFYNNWQLTQHVLCHSGENPAKDVPKENAI